MLDLIKPVKTERGLFARILVTDSTCKSSDGIACPVIAEFEYYSIPNKEVCKTVGYFTKEGIIIDNTFSWGCVQSDCNLINDL